MGANASTAVPLYASGEVLDAARLNLTNAGVPVFSGTATRDAAFGGSGEKVLAEGQLCYLEDSNSILFYDSASWQSLTQVAIFNETQASGTDGGTFTAGSFVKRTLNTTVVNNITGCTLTSSVIALPAGTYQVSAFAPGFEVQRNKTKLRNTTDGTDLAIGFSNFSSNVSTGYNFAYLETSFVLAGTKNIELQHRCEATRATLGLGIASSFSVSEIYSTITIVKIA